MGIAALWNFINSYPYQLVPAPDGGEAAPLAPAVVGLQGENGMLKVQLRNAHVIFP